jgi:hypothetical protein
MEDFPPLAAIRAKTWPDDGIEQEVHHVVGKRTADEKLDRNVVNPLRVLTRIGLMGAQPSVRKNVSNRARRRLVALPSIGGVGLDDIVVLQMPFVERIWRA